MTDNIKPLDVNRFEDVDRYIPVPEEWVLLGKREIQSKKNGKTTTYTLIEYKLQDGLIVGLFVSDMAQDVSDAMAVRTMVRKSAMERAVLRATEQVKNGRA